MHKSASRFNVVKPRPIITTANQTKAREITGDHVVIGLSFGSYRLRKWHKYPGPITEQSKAKAMQSIKIAPIEIKMMSYDDKESSYNEVITLCFSWTCLIVCRIEHHQFPVDVIIVHSTAYQISSWEIERDNETKRVRKHKEKPLDEK